MKQEVTVNKIDDKMIADLESAYKAIHASKDLENEIYLNLNNATGDIEKAFQAAGIMHSEANKTITPCTKATGTLDTAASLLFAVGYPGKRFAKPDVQFTLNEGQPYTAESQAEDLEGTDALLYDAYIKMGGNKKMVLEMIKSGKNYSATIGKKMKIVDEIDGFKNIFASQKISSRSRKKPSGKMFDASEIDSDIKSKVTEMNPDQYQKKDSKTNQRKPSLRGKKS